jgi:hypothetical protein
MRITTGDGFPLFVCAVCLVVLTLSAGSRANEPRSVRIIFDTDMAGDVDDVGALAMLHVLTDREEVELVACMISSNNPHSAGCLDALNTWYGRPDIPIGTASRFGQLAGVAADAVVESKYTRQIAEEFVHDIAKQGTEPSTRLYRKLLAAEEGKVTIVTVGFLGNIADLLESPGDEVSPLTGRELVEQKVEQWVCMGGIFPEGKFPNGDGEYNVKFGVDGARVAIDKWPGKIVFSGFEIGQPIGTGKELAKLPATNPIRRGFELYNGLTNNSSWDQTAVLFAARGAGEYWTLSEPGQCSFPEGSTGQVEWTGDPEGEHLYLKKKMPPEKLAELIEGMMMTPPAAKR